MSQRVCPWWIGMLMVSPVRKWVEDPEKLLGPYIREGMTILEPGPAMGFFTLPMARMTGNTGRVIAVDLQAKMLESLRKRAGRAGLLDRIELRQAQPDSLQVEDLSGKVDLVVAIYVVHEMPSEERFFREATAVLKPGGALLLMEPSGHVSPAEFNHEVQSALDAGLLKSDRKINPRGSGAHFIKVG
jgi:ubiquinone/menaquinone biosynthesis C-methylase UbiE